MQVSEQLVGGHCLGVDVAPHRLHLHVSVGSMQRLQDLKEKATFLMNTRMSTETHCDPVVIEINKPGVKMAALRIRL